MSDSCIHLSADSSSWVSNKHVQNQLVAHHLQFPHFSNWHVCPSSRSSQTPCSPPCCPSYTTFHSPAHPVASTFYPGSDLFSPATQLDQGPRQHFLTSPWLPERSPSVYTFPLPAIYTPHSTPGEHGPPLSYDPPTAPSQGKSCGSHGPTSPTGHITPSAPLPLPWLLSTLCSGHPGLLALPHPSHLPSLPPAPDLCSLFAPLPTVSPISLALTPSLPSGPAQISLQGRGI